KLAYAQACAVVHPPIRTFTVGPGISPDQPAIGRVADFHRRFGISPTPEHVGSPSIMPYDGRPWAEGRNSGVLRDGGCRYSAAARAWVASSRSAVISAAGSGEPYTAEPATKTLAPACAAAVTVSRDTPPST